MQRMDRMAAIVERVEGNLARLTQAVTSGKPTGAPGSHAVSRW